MDELEKSKHILTSRPWSGYVALLVAVGLCVGMALGMYKTSLWFRSDFIYPLILVLHYWPVTFVFGLSVIGVCLGLAGFALYRQVHAILVIFAGLLGAAIFSLGVFCWMFSPDLIRSVQNSVVYEGRVYHLIVASKMTLDESTYEYRVLHCDEWGLMCRPYTTPYKYTDSYEGFKDFDATGRLIVVDGRLSLKLGETLYPMAETTHIRTDSPYDRH